MTDQDEFSDTPYAASFGPVPTSTYRPYQTFRVAEREPSAEAWQAEPEPAPEGDPEPEAERGTDSPAPAEPPQTQRVRRGTVPPMKDVVMDETLASTLAAVEQLGAVPFDDPTEWQARVDAVLAGLKTIQGRWQVLEAERRGLVRPTGPVGPTATGRGGRGRGRGRGRRRGRWRAI